MAGTVRVERDTVEEADEKDEDTRREEEEERRNTMDPTSTVERSTR